MIFSWLKKSALREFLITAVVAALVFIGVQITLQSSIVYGQSMEPNFWNEQRLLISRISYRMHAPERGDVVVFRPPGKSEEDNYIKRIVGLPGEYVEMRDGLVLIHQPDGNVLRLTEPYIQEAASYTYRSDVIGEDEYFVLGDNRNRTNDSHNGWMVPLEAIVGKAWISVWPPSLWGMAANYPPEDMAIAATD